MELTKTSQIRLEIRAQRKNSPFKKWAMTNSVRAPTNLHFAGEFFHALAHGVPGRRAAVLGVGVADIQEAGQL